MLKTLTKNCKIGSGFWELDWEPLLDRELNCGSSSAVERLLAKEEVVGSNPIFRSIMLCLRKWRTLGFCRLSLPVLGRVIRPVLPFFLPDGGSARLFQRFGQSTVFSVKFNLERGSWKLSKASKLLTRRFDGKDKS